MKKRALLLMTWAIGVSASMHELPALGEASSEAPTATASVARPDAEAVAPGADADVAAGGEDSIPLNESKASSGKANRPSGSNRLIEEIVVTAQRREERLQDVPIAIAAFSADKLDAQGVTTADGLARITPGLTFTKLGGFPLVYLRGVGTEAFLPGADQTVPEYIDGVNVIGSQGAQYDLGRVERIEVLKGPQGTLFGRNSTGGAINLITPKPSDKFEGDVSLEVGNFGAFNKKGFINIPIIDGLAATLSGFDNVHDEYYTNASGPIFKQTYQRGAQGKIRWDATENIDFTAFGELSRGKVSDSLVLENTRPSQVFGAAITPDKLDRVAHNDVLGGSKTRDYLISATAEWRLPWFDTKVIGSTQRFDSPFNQFDFDGSALPLISFEVPKQFARQKTAELQILSNHGTPFSEHFEWVAGLYYLNGLGGFQRLDLFVAQSGLLTALPGGRTLQNVLDDQLVAIGLPPTAGAVDAVAGGLIYSSSASAYVQGTYHVTDAIDLTLGGRYARETRGIRDSRLGVADPVNQNEIDAVTFNAPDLKTNQFAPRVALKWQVLEQAQIYSSWSRGFQSPTYNSVNFFSRPDAVKEVRVDSYELGTKATLLDGILQVDSAAFYIKEKNVTNAFVSLTSGGVVRFSNVAGATIYGAEFNGTLAPLRELDPGLAVVGGFSYLHAEYTNFKNGPGFDEQTGLEFGPGVIATGRPRDFSGNQITRTPRWTATASINQSFPIYKGVLELGLDAYYNSGFFVLPQDSKIFAVPSYQYLNGRASYFFEPWNVELTGYVLNALDAKYVDSIFPTDFGRQEHLSFPRLFGFKAKWTF